MYTERKSKEKQTAFITKLHLLFSTTTARRNGVDKNDHKRYDRMQPTSTAVRAV
jgi:hypothetical protein